MSNILAQANVDYKSEMINRDYVAGNITLLYKAGKGGTHDGLTVIRRQASRGNTHVTVERPNGEQWKLSASFNSRTMRYSYSADCIKRAVEQPAEEVIEERTIGGVDYALKRIRDTFIIEETIIGAVFQSDPPYGSLTEAKFAFEVITGRAVAQSQDFAGDDGDYDGDPIGYSESTQPYMF